MAVKSWQEMINATLYPENSDYANYSGVKKIAEMYIFSLNISIKIP